MELISFSFRRHFHPGISCLQLIVLCLVVLHAATATPLALNFYEKTFPNVGDIVQNITWEYTSDNPELASKFLRMHFHDCFVRGCDVSILLDSTPTNKAEKDAIPNLFLVGYNVIDKVKIALEQKCPRVVSCADILALVARDSVSFQFKMHMWAVPMGRRDGNISRDIEALSDLPSPFSNFSTLLSDFASKGLDAHDLDVLSGELVTDG
nr:peroxidase 3-like [Ipomoea batatas]